MTPFEALVKPVETVQVPELEPEATEKLNAMIVKTGLDVEKTRDIITEYRKIVIPIKEFHAEAMAITVTSRDQKEDIERAALLLKEAKKGKIELKRVHDVIKSDVLKASQIIDGSERVIREDFFEPLIAHLATQALFVKNLEAKEKAEKIAARKVRIAEVSDLAHDHECETFSDDNFEVLISRLASAKAERLELERLRIEAEENRRAAERAENARIAAENERLRAENAAKNAEIEAERRKREAAETESRVAREIAERAQRAEFERAAKEEADKAKAAALIAAAPDREKVRQYFTAIQEIAKPELTDFILKQTMLSFDDRLKSAIAQALSRFPSEEYVPAPADNSDVPF